MTTLLEQHNKFIFIPSADSLDVELEQCVLRPGLVLHGGGGFAVDGSMINLFENLSCYDETFYDRKSRYLLNCQVCASYIMLLHLVAECYGAITAYCNAT
jgi:hypothetical protein